MLKDLNVNSIAHNSDDRNRSDEQNDTYFIAVSDEL
jgi:hypothetical protein